MTNDNIPSVLSGQPIPTTDSWTWVATYADGTALAEFMSDGDHGFGEVDHTRLVAVSLVPLREHLHPLEIRLTPGRNQRAIFFRRRGIIQTHDPSTGAPQQIISPAVHCIGKQETVNGKNVSIYIFTDDLGAVLITDDYNAV